jgi:hypothetical protein
LYISRHGNSPPYQELAEVGHAGIETSIMHHSFLTESCKFKYFKSLVKDLPVTFPVAAVVAVSPAADDVDADVVVAVDAVDAVADAAAAVAAAAAAAVVVVAAAAAEATRAASDHHQHIHTYRNVTMKNGKRGREAHAHPRRPD